MTDLRADENAAVKAACRYMKRAWKLANKTRSFYCYSAAIDLATALRVLDLARVQLEYAQRRANNQPMVKTQVTKV